MSSTLEIPIFPLSTVLFPGGRLPLQIFEPRYLAMTAQCLREQSVFGVTLIRGGFEVGKPAIPWEMGCTARIIGSEQPGADRYFLMTQGETVFRIERRWTQDDGLVRARVQLQEPPDPTPVPAQYGAMVEVLRRLATQVGPTQFPSPTRFDDAGWVAFRFAEMLPITPERRQRILELNDPVRALEDVQAALEELRGDPSGSG